MICQIYFFILQMKFFLLAILFLVACNDNRTKTQKISADTTKSVNTLDTLPIENLWVDKLNGNKYYKPDSFNYRPASFYLSNPKVSPIAKALYNEQFRPEDNDSTTQLLALITTDNNEIRPFYRWCLDLTIQISDGALAEYPGEPALKYAIKFPREFMDYMNSDTSLARYGRWTEIITYSGLPNQDSTYNYNYIVRKMSVNCKDCSKQTLDSIKIFAKAVIAGLKNLD
jgi:hypothetical protein